MKPTQFAVVETGDAWRIHINGHPVARFHRQLDAVNCAADLAADVQRGGGLIELLVRDLAGEITVIDSEESARSRSGA